MLAGIVHQNVQPAQFLGDSFTALAHASGSATSINRKSPLAAAGAGEKAPQ
jgi:hypothetical protein